MAAMQANLDRLGNIRWALLAFAVISTPATLWFLYEYYQRRVLGKTNVHRVTKKEIARKARLATLVFKCTQCQTPYSSAEQTFCANCGYKVGLETRAESRGRLLLKVRRGLYHALLHAPVIHSPTAHPATQRPRAAR